MDSPYPKRLGWRDVGQIGSTVFITVVGAVLVLGVSTGGGVIRWLAGLAMVLGLIGLIGIGVACFDFWGRRKAPKHRDRD
ncbi:hypothetical protein ACQPX6_17005 [Actinomycetospora sp. CA-101289]|uniref:hypothetical protein n=1 Tax=Actinomycetospora sp. CA-101289 TaxID=3239893 RepID=UPI003D98324D